MKKHQYNPVYSAVAGIGFIIFGNLVFGAICLLISGVMALINISNNTAEEKK